MPKSKPLIDASGEVRELTAVDMKHSRRAGQALPRALRVKLDVRGPQKGPTK